MPLGAPGSGSAAVCTAKALRCITAARAPPRCPPSPPCLPPAPRRAPASLRCSAAASKTPSSVYNIQLLEVVGGSDPTTYAAMGASQGFYQVCGVDCCILLFYLQPLAAPAAAQSPNPRLCMRACTGTCSKPPPRKPPPATHGSCCRPPRLPPLQIQPIDSRPAWLMALVGVFCTLGPITLAGFFTYEKVGGTG